MEMDQRQERDEAKESCVVRQGQSGQLELNSAGVREPGCEFQSHLSKVEADASGRPRS